tara:strand:+ start:1112 stop:1393 length:282 start_codon:yes stop_codon:yes gene_type:complete
MNPLQLLEDPFVGATLGLAIVLYAGKAAPELPAEIKDLFSNDYFRVLVLFLVSYTSTKNYQLSLLVAVAFFVVLSQLSKEAFVNSYVESFNSE